MVKLIAKTIAEGQALREFETILDKTAQKPGPPGLRVARIASRGGIGQPQEKIGVGVSGETISKAVCSEHGADIVIRLLRPIFSASFECVPSLDEGNLIDQLKRVLSRLRLCNLDDGLETGDVDRVNVLDVFGYARQALNAQIIDQLLTAQ